MSDLRYYQLKYQHIYHIGVQPLLLKSYLIFSMTFFIFKAICLTMLSPPMNRAINQTLVIKSNNDERAKYIRFGSAKK